MPKRTDEARLDMPRRRPKIDADAAARRQYNVGIPADVAARLERTAQALGYESATALIRVLVTSHLPPYEKRADAVERGEDPDRPQG